jgi:hypothetical protein
MQRVDQQMARVAASMLPAQAAHDRTLRTRYRTLRVMCHSSGLAATYAYVASKSRGGDKDPAPAYRLVRDGVGDRLAELGLVDRSHTHDPRAVLRRLGDLDALQYTTASAQITVLLGWLARLADAVFTDALDGSAGPGSAGPVPVSGESPDAS